MSSRIYADTVVALIEEVVATQAAAIDEAAAAVARSLANGGRIWLAKTTHCLHSEAHHRAGGYMAVHMLDDTAVLTAQDCVIAGSPVGAHETTVQAALEIKERGACLIALTNVAFENDVNTVRGHESGKVLHQIADIVVDLGGPLGDGVFDAPEYGIRVVPHSGVVGMTAMWMIFADAIDHLRAMGMMPLLYECIAVRGAKKKNDRAWSTYVTSGRGAIAQTEVGPIANT